MSDKGESFLGQILSALINSTGAIAAAIILCIGSLVVAWLTLRGPQQETGATRAVAATSAMSVSPAGLGSPSPGGPTPAASPPTAITKTQIAEPTSPPAPTEPTMEQVVEPSATASPVASIEPCPGRVSTGIGLDKSLDVQVSAGEVAYAAGWGWDGQDGGYFVTFWGPYSGIHTLYNGLYCPPMPADSELAQRTEAFVWSECESGGGCPHSISLGPIITSTPCTPQVGLTPPDPMENGEWIYDCLSSGLRNWVGQSESWARDNWGRGAGQSELVNIVVPEGAQTMGLGCDPCTVIMPDGSTISPECLSTTYCFGPFEPNFSVDVTPGEVYRVMVFGSDTCPSREDVTPPCAPQVYIWFNLR